jgi:hypothetical protein
MYTQIFSLRIGPKSGFLMTLRFRRCRKLLDEESN